MTTSVDEDRNSSVSVVLPTYRRSRRIRGAVESVLAQTHRNLELWIVDDNGASTDEQLRTRDVIESFDDPRVRYIALRTNSGGSNARNRGIAACRGDLLACLDDDDRWPSDRLAHMVRRFDAGGPELGLVYGTTLYVDDAGRERMRLTASKEGRVFDDLIRSNFIGGTGSVMFRTAIVRDVGGFDPEMPAMQDVDLFLRVCRSHEVGKVDGIVNRTVEHGDGRITDDHSTRAAAWRKRLDKYSADYGASRSLSARGRAKLARELVKAGDRTAARAEFRRAMTLVGPRPDLLFRYLRTFTTPGAAGPPK